MSAVQIDRRHRTLAEQRAKRYGLSVSEYVAQLIDRDLDGEADAAADFEQVTAPIAAAMADVSDEELEALVEEARNAHHAAEKNRQRKASR